MNPHQHHAHIRIRTHTHTRTHARRYSRVVVPLRDPLVRIASGVADRVRSHSKPWQRWNRLFREAFGGEEAAADAFVTALRLPDHPKHKAAMEATLGPQRGHYMLPITQFYLDGANGTAEAAFVCADSLRSDFNSLAHRWGLAHNMSSARAGCIGCSASQEPGQPDAARPTAAQLRPATRLWKPRRVFSEDNARWLRSIYAEDFRLLAEHCPPGRFGSE